VADDKVDAVVDAILTEYYQDAIKKYPEAAERYSAHPDNAILTLRPAAGARVMF
jgi:hypothetical protein